jgi:hypothetical protein
VENNDVLRVIDIALLDITDNLIIVITGFVVVRKRIIYGIQIYKNEKKTKIS